MGATIQIQLECSHPQCEKTQGIETTRSAYLADLGTLRLPLPEGWAARNSGRVIACPTHGIALLIAEQDLHHWKKAEVDAQNAWVRANPPPSLPSWTGLS